MKAGCGSHSRGIQYACQDELSVACSQHLTIYQQENETWRYTGQKALSAHQLCNYFTAELWIWTDQVISSSASMQLQKPAYMYYMCWSRSYFTTLQEILSSKESLCTKYWQLSKVSVKALRAQCNGFWYAEPQGVTGNEAAELAQVLDRLQIAEEEAASSEPQVYSCLVTPPSSRTCVLLVYLFLLRFQMEIELSLQETRKSFIHLSYDKCLFAVISADRTCLWLLNVSFFSQWSIDNRAIGNPNL